MWEKGFFGNVLMACRTGVDGTTATRPTTVQGELRGGTTTFRQTPRQDTTLYTTELCFISHFSRDRFSLCCGQSERIAMTDAKQPQQSAQANPEEDDSVPIGLSINYWQSLVQYVEDERGEPALGEFAKLQAMNLTHLLNKIVRIKANIEHSRTTSLEQMD